MRQPALFEATPTDTDIERLHQQNRAHVRACGTCDHSGTRCAEGQALIDDRDTAAADFAEAQALRVPGAQITGRKGSMVHLDLGPDLRAGIFHFPYDRQWRVIVGRPSQGIRAASGRYCEASEITATLQALRDQYTYGGEDQ